MRCPNYQKDCEAQSTCNHYDSPENCSLIRSALTEEEMKVIEEEKKEK